MFFISLTLMIFLRNYNNGSTFNYYNYNHHNHNYNYHYNYNYYFYYYYYHNYYNYYHNHNYYSINVRAWVIKAGIVLFILKSYCFKEDYPRTKASDSKAPFSSDVLSKCFFGEYTRVMLNIVISILKV